MKQLLIILSLVGLCFSSSCKKKKEDDTTPTTHSDSIYVPVSYAFTGNGEDVRLQRRFHVVGLDSSLQLTRMDLYISNIALTDAAGNVWIEKNSYHLLSALPEAGIEKASFSLVDVPAGTYNSLRFSFGIDSAHNHTLDHAGDLDPANGMAWDWNTGYRFLVMEGKVGDSTLLWHVGTDKNYRTRTVNLPSPLVVTSAGEQKTLPLAVRMDKVFFGAHALSPLTNREMMHDPIVTGLAADNLIEALEFSLP